MTEAEATEKWCPFARAGIRYAEGNRDPDGGPRAPCRCIASACMAWRWSQHRLEFSYDEKRPDGDGWEPSPFVPVSMRPLWQRPRENRGGYCGLAGTPGMIGD
jgi:hypothetical protein